MWIQMPQCLLGQAGKRQPTLDVKQRGVKPRPPIARLFFELLQGFHFELLSCAVTREPPKNQAAGRSFAKEQMSRDEPKNHDNGKQNDAH